MTGSAAAIREIAEILVPPALAGPRPPRSIAVLFSVSELRPILLTFMGQGGVRTLVARALYLAGRACPAFLDVKASTDGSLSGLEQATRALTDAEFREAHVSLLGEILKLILQFLGPGATMTIIREAWPDARLGALDLSGIGQS